MTSNLKSKIENLKSVGDPAERAGESRQSHQVKWDECPVSSDEWIKTEKKGHEE
jgi:hypothetical protein